MSEVSFPELIHKLNLAQIGVTAPAQPVLNMIPPCPVCGSAAELQREYNPTMRCDDYTYACPRSGEGHVFYGFPQPTADRALVSWTMSVKLAKESEARQ